MKNYRIDILDIAEARWNDAGEMRLTSGDLILYPGHPEEQAIHSEGSINNVKKRREATH